MFNDAKHLLLVGTGSMGIAYANVIIDLKLKLTVIGRGENSAQKFKEEIGIDPVTGGLSTWLSTKPSCPKYAIIAVNVENLAQTAIELMNYGVEEILLEKPGGLNFDEIQDVYNHSKQNESKIYIAYNRRFYTSVRETKRIIQDDGGVSSFNFEFTEWSHIIEDLEILSKLKEEWFLANSSHVIDLAFYLGGTPKELKSFVKGSLPWHPKGSIFSGAGITESKALFSYSANWEAPGRWGVEILTKNNRLILRPLEKLQIQKIGSILIESYDLDDELDIKFKPGLYLQIVEFVKKEKNNLLITLEDHLERCKTVFMKILDPST